MYVTKDKNREYALRFWKGKPSAGLMWKFMAPWCDSISAVSREQGYNSGDRIADNLDFFAEKLGCITHGIFTVCKTENKDERVMQSEDCGMLVRKYRSSHGVFSEKLMDGQIIEYKIKTPDDLKAYTAILKNTQVTNSFKSFQKKLELYSDRMPMIVEPGTASAAQQFMQYETGVMNFWYFAEDCPLLLEECMDEYQSLMTEKYKLMQQVECDGFFQGENTSTAMISPEYYRKYGVPQVKQFVDAAHTADKRAMVHMCGHLHDLMPMIKETGMNGIHALTPAPIGNTEFEYAYSIMPPDTSIMGRFGAQAWVGKSKNEIISNLGKILPHQIYQEYPFVLIVTSDLEKFTIDDLYNLRDAIAEYEQKF